MSGVIASRDITLTQGQRRAFEASVDWFNSVRRQPFFKLFGYAGTGKTTLLQYIAKQIPGTVLFAAPTGKAASVLRAKGCRGASTIHYLAYALEGHDAKGRPLLRLPDLGGRRSRAAPSTGGPALLPKRSRRHAY